MKNKPTENPADYWADKACHDLGKVAEFLGTASRFFGEKYNDKTGSALANMAMVLLGYIQKDIRKLQELGQPRSLGHN